MNIDWSSLIHQFHEERWNTIAAMLGAFWDALWKMVASGEPTQIILAILFIGFVAINSGRIILKLIFRLARNDALSF